MFVQGPLRIIIWQYKMATDRFLEQRRAAGITDDPMWFVYILELKPDQHGVPKYYVGHTCRLQRRMHDHMTGKSVEWVRRYGVNSVLEVIRTTEADALGLEVAKTTFMKAKRGWQNVRGGVDNNPRDSPLPPYWEAPARGLSPHRVRSRSPRGNIDDNQNDDEHSRLPEDEDHS